MRIMKAAAIDYTKGGGPARAAPTLGIAAGLFVVTLLVFGRVVYCDFVQWDDDTSVYLNPHVQGLDASRLKWMFTDVSYAMRYKPLTWLIYAVVYSVCGLRPAGYHWVGLLFHCGNAALLYLALRRLLGNGLPQRMADLRSRDALAYAAGLGALLWAVHPLRAEPVARITDVTYPCSLFFTLVSLLFYLRFADDARKGEGGWRWYAFAVAAFALAMLVYPFVCGYAAALAMLDYYPLRRFDRDPKRPSGAGPWRVWLEKAPFAAFGSLIVVTFVGRIHPLETWKLESVDPGFGLFARAMQAFYVWSYYLWKPWAPVNLSPVYTRLLAFSPAAWPFVLSAIAFVGLTVLFIWKRREWPLALTLWVCHLALLAPALGITEHPHFTNDRYSYVPGTLWAALIAAGMAKAWDRARPRAWALGLAGGAALVFAGLTFHQLRIWRNSETLFADTIAKLGDHRYRADIYWRLGRFYIDSGRSAEGVKQYEESLRIFPCPLAYERLATVLGELGKPDEASAKLRESVELWPAHYAKVHNDSGRAFFAQGDYARAVQDFSEALILDPNNASARFNRAMACYYTKDYKTAWEDVKIAQRLGMSFPRRFLEALAEKSGRTE